MYAKASQITVDSAYFMMELQHTDVASVTPLELLSLERQLLETCQELNMKRKQLTDCHSELDKMVVRQHQLEQTLVEERRKSEAMRLQLEVAVGAVQRCDEDKNSFQAELSRLRVEMEITVRDRDSFKQQYHTYKMENLTLIRRIDELQAQLHCQQIYQAKCSEQETKLSSALDELKREIQVLEQDKKRLDRSYKFSEEIMTKLKESHKKSSLVLQKCLTEKKLYEGLIVELRAQITSLKMQNSLQIKETRLETHNETRQYLQDLKNFLSSESEGSHQLTEALQKALEAQSTLEVHEQEVRTKLKHQEQEMLQQNNTIADLKHSLQLSEENVRKLEEQLKQLDMKIILASEGKDGKPDKLPYKDQATQIGYETVSDVVSSSSQENVQIIQLEA